MIDLHTTAHECAFIENLGIWSAHNFGRRYLIERYITALSKRVAWGSINPAQVRAKAMDVLSRLREKEIA